MDNKIATSLLVSALLISSVFSSEDLTNVVVSAKTQNSALDTAGSFSIITEDDIKKTGASSIKEVLEGVVGVNMGVNNASINGRQSISIRGTDSKDTLILVDGERISGSDAQIGHSDFQYNWIPVNAISKIEVIRGPMSSLYGSRAIGGIINIITKKPKGDFEGEISIEGGGESSRHRGSNGDFQANAGGSVTDKLSVFGFAQVKEQDLSSEDSNTAIEGKSIRNAMIKAIYEIDKTQEISAFAIYGEEKRKTTTYDEYYDIDKEHYSLGYKKDWDDVTLRLKAYTNISDSHTDEFDYTHEMQDDTLNSELDIAYFDNHFIVLGAEYRNEEYRKRYDNAADDASKGFKEDIDYKSFYFQDEIAIGDDLILTLGGRYDDHERFSGEFSPKANIVYKLSDNSRIKAGYGHGFSAPTVTQISDEYEVFIPTDFTGFPFLATRFHGNDDLEPETSDTYELSFEYEKGTLSYSATVFHTDFEDLIDTQVYATVMEMPFLVSQSQYVNIGKAEINGVELEFTKNQLINNLDLSLNYTFLDTENKDTNEDLANRPDHTANLKLTTILPWEIGSTLRVNYVGEQEASDGDTIDDYATVGLQFSKIFMEDLTLRAGAENLGNVTSIGDGVNKYTIRGRYIYGRISYKF